MIEPERQGDYASRGDYHEHLDPNWSYAPIYVCKLGVVDRFVGELPSGARILDAGAGEGTMVERYQFRGYECVGVDVQYESDRVRKGSILALPFADGSFDAVLCLDVLEHLHLLEQARALGEIHRVLVEGGHLLLSVPNLAHLHSRLSFLLSGRLTRTSAVERHPGDRPVQEVLDLLSTHGFQILDRRGIFPTVPLLFRLVNRHPRQFGWLVHALSRLLPVRGWCFLNIIMAGRIH